jgi:hypothetical protein
MDNSVDLPGYKYYVDPADGSRPAVFVAFLDLVPDPACAVNGIVFPVSGDELRALDARERNYARVDVTDRLPVDGRAWTYTGTDGARDRFARAMSRGEAVVDRAYLELVRASFAALGAGELTAFHQSTDPPGVVPIRSLSRVDVPAGT